MGQRQLGMFSDDPRDDLMMENKAHFLNLQRTSRETPAEALDTNPTERNQQVY